LILICNQKIYQVYMDNSFFAYTRRNIT
jgi:hypothetical protein